MKKLNKSNLAQSAKQQLLKWMLPSSSNRRSPNGITNDPGEFALWSIERAAEAKSTRMTITGRTRRLLPEIGQLDSHLRELEISHDDISDLSPLKKLPSLKSLKISGTNVIDWSPLDSMKNLERLEIGYSGKAHFHVPDLPELLELRIMNNHGNISLGELPKLIKADFQVLVDLAEVSKQPKLSELSFLRIGNRNLNALASLTNLRTLDGRLHGAVDLRLLVSQGSLRSLRLIAPDVSDISPISALSNLETLELHGFKVASARALSDLSNLRSLNLNFAAPLADLSFLSKMKEVSRLVLRPAANCDLHPLTELPNLRTVFIPHVSPHTDLSPLTGCEELRQLSVSLDGKVDAESFGALPRPPRLEALRLSGRAFNCLNGLEKCQELRFLNCWGTTVDDLEPLRGMPKLKHIHLERSNVADLSVLATLPYFLDEDPDIKLAVQDTPAIERYPELAETVGGGGRYQYEYGQHETAVAAVRAVTRVISP